MNVSMQDGFNLGWKLASVLRKRSAPHLLHTYSAERQAIAKELIDFDREWAALIASSKGFDPAETQRYFVQHGRYTAGTATRYRPALLTGEATHQHLAEGADDRDALSFRAGHPRRGREASSPRPRRQGGRALAHLRLCGGGGSRRAQLRHPGAVRISRRGAGVAGQEIHAGGRGHRRGDRCPCGFPAGHHELASKTMPSLLLPPKGRYGLRDYEKIFCADLKAARTSSRCAASIASGAAW